MKKTALFLLLFSVPVFSTFCQEALEQEKQKRPLDLRLNILGLIDVFDTNLSLAVESRRTDKIALIFEAGWIFYSQYLSMSKKTNGVILRPAFRYYANPEKNRFVEVELHYKSVIYNIEDWIGRECSGNVPSYDQFTTFKFRKQAYGFHLRGGMKGALDREKSFWVEFSPGIGLRWKTQGLHREPNSCYFRGEGFFEFEVTENAARPVFPMALRLLYRIQ